MGPLWLSLERKVRDVLHGSLTNWLSDGEFKCGNGILMWRLSIIVMVIPYFFLMIVRVTSVIHVFL